MDIDGDSFLGHSGRLGPLPQRYRTAKWGVRKSKKKSESASVEQAEQSERLEGTECGSVDYAAAVGASGELPQSVKEYIEGRLAALASTRPQSNNVPRASGPNGKAMPWGANTTWQQYKDHYTTFPGPTTCPFNKVYHNLAPHRAQMKKLGKQACACIQGYDINTGDAKGENYTQQATPSARKRVWEMFKVIEDKSKDQWNATPKGDEGARARV
jgi:hypothetical protein